MPGSKTAPSATERKRRKKTENKLKKKKKKKDLIIFKINSIISWWYSIALKNWWLFKIFKNLNSIAFFDL